MMEEVTENRKDVAPKASWAANACAMEALDMGAMIPEVDPRQMEPELVDPKSLIFSPLLWKQVGWYHRRQLYFYNLAFIHRTQTSHHVGSSKGVKGQGIYRNKGFDGEEHLAEASLDYDFLLGVRFLQGWF